MTQGKSPADLQAPRRKKDKGQIPCRASPGLGTGTVLPRAHHKQDSVPMGLKTGELLSQVK